MIDWAVAAILGVIQGATEYLPVSSSGHLVIAQSLFGLEEPELLFDIVLHLGTLSAVVWYYWRDLLAIVAESRLAVGDARSGRPLAEIRAERPAAWMAFLIVIGSVPTGIIGVFFKDFFESLFASPATAGSALIVTAAILLATRFSHNKNIGQGAMTVGQALLIGFVQGLAITPGISRSGITIATALFMGIERETAARFSFLLSIPSIAGALVLQFDPSQNHTSLANMAIGFTTSALTGAICLVFLVAIVKRDRLHWFAPYCLAAGILTLIYVA